MRPIFVFPICLACLFVATDARADDVTALLKVIQSSEAADVDRANAFEKIGDIASADVVGSLSEYLGDTKWGHYARIALQKMEGKDVTEALLASLDAVEGDLKLGVIETLGRRGDSVAIAPLAQLLTPSDSQLAAAAAIALGEIGNAAAAAKLGEALRVEKEPHRKESLASALLLAGQRLEKNGNPQAAIRLFDHLTDLDLPKPFRIGATHNAILARGTGGVDQMVEQLTSPDRDFFQIGLAVARVLPGSRATQAITEVLKSEVSSDRQALLILALRDRGDKQALQSIIDRLQSVSTDVRTAAIDAIGSLGDDASAPILLAAVDAENADTVVRALVSLPGANVNAVLMKAAQPPSPSSVAIRALGKRRAEEAVPLLLELSRIDSAAVSQEAIVALGMAAGQQQLLDLFTLLNTATSTDRQQAIQKAIQAAVFRSTKPDACTEALGAMIPGASGKNREFLFEQIRTAGGARAIALMQSFTTGSDESLQDAATKTLGRWLSADAAPLLLQVAQDEGKFANRALGGYIRIFRQFELPESERLAMASNALSVSKRPAERIAAINAMTRFPCPGSFELALEQLDVPGSEATAAKAVLTIGRTVLDLDPETGRAGLEKLIDADIGQDVTNAAKALLR